MELFWKPPGVPERYLWLAIVVDCGGFWWVLVVGGEEGEHQIIQFGRVWGIFSKDLEGIM